MDYKEQITTRSQAQSLLDKMKKMESKTKLHRFVLNDKTVVYCKNKDRINDYIKQS
jgi:retron-type reverse transcriptase